MAYSVINKSTDNFNTKTYTGTNAVLNVTGVGHQPDLVWIKDRSGTNSGSHNHNLIDSVRGAPKILMSDSSAAEITDTTDGFTAFAADGFTLGANNAGTQSQELNGHTNGGNQYVSWNWKAGGTAPTQTYTVKVVSDGGNKYRFDDFGTSAVTLDLQEGGTYTFDVSDSSMNSHPFVIGTAANGTEYSTGVTYKLDGVTKTYSQYTSGFSSASSRQLIITLAASAPALYYWCSVHSGMGGAINTNSTHGSSNFSGSIQSTVSVNATAGFSIVKWTGNAVTGATIGHGLGAKPAAIILKNISPDTASWPIYHHKLGATKYIALDSNGAASTSNTRWNDTEPSTSVFTTGSSGDVKGDNSGEPFIAYCFAQVNGFSKFGFYNGNNNTNGSFIYTGFKPRFVMIKHDGSSNWTINDSARDVSNPNAARLFPNQTVAETSGSESMDLYSNGFKLKSTDGGNNGAGGTYYYFAFGQPLVGSNNVPATAF